MPVNDELASEQWYRYQWCRDRGHLDFVAKADKCDKFFAGDQWLQQDLNTLTLQRRPALTINKIISTIGTILGEQIYNRTEVLFRPSSGAPAEVADALSKVWLQISQNNQLPWVRSDVFCDGIVRSRGFYDLRLDFTDNMMGEVRCTQLNSKNVVIDPDAEEYDPDFWADVFVTKWLTFQDIATLYSKEDAEYLRTQPGTSTPYNYDSIEQMRDRFAGVTGIRDFVQDPHGLRRAVRTVVRQYRKLDNQEHFVDLVTGDMRPIPSEWDRNRIAHVLEKAGSQLSTIKKKVKRIRWTTTAGNVVLHDDWSPYKHFTVVPYFPYFRYGRTIGIVENLLGPQEILNKVSSQELHIVNTTANSGWVVEQDSLLNMTLSELESKGAQTGLVIEYRKGAQPPEKIQPNQTPTGLDRISYKAEEHIKTISNVSDSMQGFDREDVAAKAIAYKQQRGSVNMTKALDNLERTDWILARNTLDIIQSYYTEPRLLNITHDDVSQEQEELQVNTYDEESGRIINDLTLGEYDIVITSSPYRASLEDSQFEQARALRELGLPIPDDVLIENSRLLRRGDIIKRMQAAQNSPEAQKQAELQTRVQEAEVAKTEAEAGKIGAEAQSKTVEAQQAMSGQNPEIMKILAEMQQMREESQLERERMAAELQQMREEMMLKREDHQQEMMMRAAEHAQTQQFKVQEHAQQMEHNERTQQVQEQQAERDADAQERQQAQNDAAANNSAE